MNTNNNIVFYEDKRLYKFPNVKVTNGTTGEKNKKGRLIYKGPKGGTYVIGPSGKKLYKFTPATPVFYKESKGIYYKIHNDKKVYYINIPKNHRVQLRHVKSRNQINLPFVRFQIGPTCWFHATLNGWLLSDVGRKFLKIYLKKFKYSNNVKPYTRVMACPRRGVIPVYFWSYVEYMIKQIENPRKLDTFNAAVQLGIEYEQNAVIKNLIPERNSERRGGRVSDTQIFFDKVFTPKHWGKSIEKYYGRRIIYTKEFIEDDIPDVSGYTLSHAYITYTSKNLHRHAICGVIYKKQMYIYNSNRLEMIRCDWRNHKNLEMFLKQQYDIKTLDEVLPVYIRKDFVRMVL